MRLKTKKEFIAEYGPNWRIAMKDVFWPTNMDYLFGRELPEKVTKIDRWIITSDMITEKNSCLTTKRKFLLVDQSH